MPIPGDYYNQTLSWGSNDANIDVAGWIYTGCWTFADATGISWNSVILQGIGVEAEPSPELVAARQAAEELLRELVVEEGIAEQENYYEIPSATIKGRAYRVPKPSVGPRLIKVVECGIVQCILCVRPDLAFPVADIVLSQMINLLYNEEQTLAIAHRHWS